MENNRKASWIETEERPLDRKKIEITTEDVKKLLMRLTVGERLKETSYRIFDIRNSLHFIHH